MKGNRQKVKGKSGESERSGRSHVVIPFSLLSFAF
jgi:hypothetical protein